MRRRRGRGEGSIYRRSDGLWVGTLTTGYNEHGARRRRVIYAATKREILQKLHQLRARSLTGDLGSPERLTVAQFLSRWLEDTAKPSIRESTYTLYEGMIRRHIIPGLGGVVLSRLTPAHLQGSLAGLERDQVGPASRQVVFRVLHRALKQATLWGMVPRNVCEAVARPRAPRPAMRTFDAAQVHRLLEAAKGDRLEALYILAVSTGMRQGELLGLQWEDVDLGRGAVQIRHQLQEVAGRLSLVEPKTARSRRRVDLPALAVVALLEHRERTRTAGRSVGEGSVFTDTEGGPLRKSNLVRRSFAPLLERAKLPRICFHALRHTAATLHLQGGTHPKIVQEMLGHATISMTLDTYSHTVPSMQKEAAARMDQLLGGT